MDRASLILAGVLGMGVPLAAFGEHEDEARNRPPWDLEEVDDPKPWEWREVNYGAIVKAAVRNTWVLRRAGDRVSVRITRETAGRPRGEPRPKDWQVVSTETFVGRLERKPDELDMHLIAADLTELELRCVTKPVPVHRAGATIGHGPVYRYECDSKGVWRPASTEKVSVLGCVTNQDRVIRFGQFGILWIAFSPAPGIENIFDNSDCVLQDGGLRRRGR